MRKTKTITPFYVLNWDFNSNSLVHYDIMPYLLDEYKKLKKKDKPINFIEFRDWILPTLMRQFWSRCQYEILISDWPSSKKSEKIDIYDQALMNIEVITKIFISNTE